MAVEGNIARRFEGGGEELSVTEGMNPGVLVPVVNCASGLVSAAREDPMTALACWCWWW